MLGLRDVRRVSFVDRVEVLPAKARKLSIDARATVRSRDRGLLFAASLFYHGGRQLTV